MTRQSGHPSPGPSKALLASPGHRDESPSLLLALLVLPGPSASALAASGSAGRRRRPRASRSSSSTPTTRATSGRTTRTSGSPRSSSRSSASRTSSSSTWTRSVSTRTVTSSSFPEVYQRKYADHRIDLVVAVDDRALDFLVEHRDAVFPGKPVVFCGVNYFDEERRKGRPLVTGVSEDADLGASLDTALLTPPGYPPDLRRQRRHRDRPRREGPARPDRPVVEGRPARAARRPADAEAPRAGSGRSRRGASSSSPSIRGTRRDRSSATTRASASSPGRRTLPSTVRGTSTSGSASSAGS